MSKEKTTFPHGYAQDGLSSFLLEKGLSSGNLQTALNTPPPPPPPPPPVTSSGANTTPQEPTKK